MIRRSLFVGLAALVVSGCSEANRRSTPAGAKTPLFEGMGNHHRKVSTSSADAQAYFDQGLVWAYAFNHDEAIRSFEEAARIDPNCAMAYWGIALCNGPHINNPVMDEARSKAAYEAAQQATARMGNCTPMEQALIKAVSKRYAWPAPADRRPLDEAYASAMGDVYKEFSKDGDIGTLYAESLMDLQPWDLWTKDGQAKGRTEEIVMVLEGVISRDANHPGANHLYIHAVEASPKPERGVASADRLRRSVPAAGHLVHMPAHIDVQVGKWQAASDQNVAAMEADRKYRAISPKQGFYRIYMAHNPHFLAFSSMMEGRKAAALEAARTVVAGVPEEYGKQNAALIDPYMSIVYEVEMRFGMWDELLAEKAPPSYWPITTALWHFARGTAYAAKGEIKDAEREQGEFAAAGKRVPAGAMMSINPAHKILDIADHVLAGEIAFRRGDVDVAVRELRAGVAIEDDLLYMEPPEWVQPVRHALGAVLESAGRCKDAEAVYREDLVIWPENGWSLFGLERCLRDRGATAEADAVEKRFKTTWSRADTKIGASCVCVRTASAAGAGD